MKLLVKSNRDVQKRIFTIFFKNMGKIREFKTLGHEFSIYAQQHEMDGFP